MLVGVVVDGGGGGVWVTALFSRGGGCDDAIRRREGSFLDCLIRVHTIPGIEHEIRESPSPLGYSVGYLWQLGVPGASAAVVAAARAHAGRAAQLGRGGGHCGHGVQLGLAGGPGGGRVGRPQRAGRAVHFACKREENNMNE